MMNNIFRTLIAKGIVVVYLDDILIFTKMEEEHEQAVWKVLEVLAEHKLFLCPEKYEFQQKQIKYLGLVILENKVKMDPVKVAGVHNWPTLENWTDVQAFIGFVNFYCYFIRDFSTIARPLFDLTHSDKAWLELGYQETGSLRTSQDSSDHRSGPGIASRFRTLPHRG